MDGDAERRSVIVPGPSPSVRRVVFWGFSAVAAYFLWTEHRAHVAQFLPWALLALCPLMHLFMHRGHGHRHGPGSGEARVER